MDKTQYFSFFGAVKSAAEATQAAAWVAETLPRRCASWIERERYDDLSPYQEQSCYLRHLASDARMRHLGHLPPVLSETYTDSDGVEAVSDDFGDGSAVLIVACPAGGWAEVGAVTWPLQFTAPAAVAGVCYTPRYGL